MADEKVTTEVVPWQAPDDTAKGGMIRFGAEGDSQLTELEAIPAALVASAQREVESAVILAKRFPRDLDRSYQSIVRACKRFSFAEKAGYKFPRGKKQDANGRWVQNFVEGPSVYLARELAKAWGNIRFGITILSDDDEIRSLCGWAWDLESNLRVEMPASFKKLQQRKVKQDDGSMRTAWVTPDERDLRELTNKHGAICVRNALLSLIPADVIDDCRRVASEVVNKKVTEDPDAQRKAVLQAFDGLNVNAANLQELIGCPISQASPAQIVQLKGFYAAIRDGQTTISELLDAARADKAAVEGEKKSAAKMKPSSRPLINPRSAQELEQQAEDAGIPPLVVEEFLMTQWGVPKFSEAPADSAEKIKAWIVSQRSTES